MYTILGKNLEKTPPKTIICRDYKYFNERKFKEDLATAVEGIVESHDTVDDYRDALKSMTDEISNIHAPLKSHKLKSRKKSLDNSCHCIIYLMYRRDYIHVKAVKCKDGVLWDEYKLLGNKVVPELNTQQKLYYENEIACNENNRNGMWTSLRQVLNKTKNHCMPTELTPDRFNQFFSSIRVKVAEKFECESYEWNLPRSIYTFTFQAVGKEDVASFQRRLPDYSNLDVLNMDSKLLKP